MRGLTGKQVVNDVVDKAQNPERLHTSPHQYQSEKYMYAKP